MDKEAQDSHLVTSCLSCLINLLHRNPPNRQLFYQNQGKTVVPVRHVHQLLAKVCARSTG